VNIFFALNRHLAKLMYQNKGYVADICEIHHTEKRDSPSGTGISLAEQIIEINKDYNQWENVKKAEISVSGALPIESLRLPNVPGTHEVNYVSEIDTISIKHVAHNRKGFAQGSVLAAQWIIGKKGVFTMQDVLNF
jgi:4-hydroxy-tetrahydrodipicolinate reductase